MNLPWARAGRRGSWRVRRLGAMVAATSISVLAAGALAASSAPAMATQGSGLTLTVGYRWNSVADPGTWTAYAVTARNDAGPLFDGEVRLVPNTGGNGLPFQSIPEYHAAVSLPGGSSRTVLVYAIEPTTGYHAELHDTQGRLVARADPSVASRSSLTVGVLSDLAHADQQIVGPLTTFGRSDVAVSRFASVQDFPTNAAYLSGLNAVILDQFDSGALSRAQVQTLKDFVGVGGTLILAGGASWRREMLPLPPELVPLQPTATETAALDPLAELAGLSSTDDVQIAMGGVPSWASVAVASPDGQPLVVEGPYGAGRVLALTFDPLAEPLASRLNMAGLAWSQAITRGLSGAQGPQAYFSQFGFGPSMSGSAVNTLGGSGPGSWSAFPQYLQQILSSAAGLSPPFGLLALLLVVYALLVTAVSYVALKRIRRRGLLWVVVPGIAVVFTASAYEFGFGTRGSDFQVTQMQVQLIGPGGVVETDSVDGVVPPRRGDVRLNAGPNSLVSTAMPVFGAGSNDEPADITVGTQPEVLLPNVPVWDLRPVQTLTVTHPFSNASASAPLEARLRLDHGRVKGQVVNHTPWTLRHLQLFGGSGSDAELAAALPPGATATVDAAVSLSSSGVALGKGLLTAPGGIVTQVGPGSSSSPSPRQALNALAATRAVDRPGQLALIADTGAIGALQVEGGSTAASTLAALVEPVRLQSADSLATVKPVARLVSSYLVGASGQTDAYELDLPAGLRAGVGLISAGVAGVQAALLPVDVYDWDLHTWRTLSLRAAAGQSPVPAPLTAGETRTGVVRLRLHENGPGQTEVSAVDLP